jgi:hypothetical protein
VDGAGLPISKLGVDVIAQVRRSALNQSVIAQFDTTVTGTDDNIVTLSLDAATTAELTAGKYVWDLQEEVGGAIITRLAGEVLITSDISRD